MSSGGPSTAGDEYLQVVPVAERPVAALPPRPPAATSTAIVEYTPPAPNLEEEDLEVKLRRILECVPVRFNNTSGSSAGSGSGDFHQDEGTLSTLGILLGPVFLLYIHCCQLTSSIPPKTEVKCLDLAGKLNRTHANWAHIS